MNTTTVEARTIAAYLSVTVVFYDDEHGGGQLTYRLLPLTSLLFWLAVAGDVMTKIAAALEGWLERRQAGAAEQWQRLRLYGRLAGIGLRAIWWGVRR